MASSNFTGIAPIPERSDATPGLWNTRFTTIDVNFAAAQSTLNANLVLPGNGRTVPTLTAHLANNAVFDVLDYAPIGVTINDGVGNATSAIQAAITQATVAGGIVLLPPGSYLVTSPLNCTRAGGASTIAIMILGHGPRTTQINAQMAGASLFDCTGSSFFTFRDFSVSGNTSFTPTTAFLLARNSTAASAGGHKFENVHTLGNFSVAPVYGYASEILQFGAGCQFANSAVGKRVVVLTQTNIFALTSTFVTIATGPISTTAFDFKGVELYNSAAAGNNDCLYLDGVTALTFSGFMYTLAGRAFVFIDASVKSSSNIAIRDTMWDGNGTSYGVTVSGPFEVSRLTLDNIFDQGVKAFTGTVTAPTGGIVVYGQGVTGVGQDTSLLSNVRITNINSATNQYYRFYQVNYSHLDFNSLDTVYLRYACSGNRLAVAAATRLTVDRLDFFIGNTVFDLSTGAVVNMRQSLDVGDASKVIAANDAPTQRWDTTLTANRTASLPANAASTIGQPFRIVRTGLGNFTLTVQDASAVVLKVIPTATAATLLAEYDGSSWKIIGYGTHS